MINIANGLLYYKIIQTLAATDTCGMNRLRFFPIILIICYIPATVLRIFEALDLKVPLFLVLLSMFGDGFSGFLNSLCYGFTQHVKAFVYESLCYKHRKSGHELLVLER